MRITAELDILEPLTNLTVDIIVGGVLGVGAALWAWWRWGSSKRRELTTPDRHDFALRSGAAARQVDMLSLYDNQLVESASFQQLWPKITQCLDNLMDFGYGPAAKIATGNAGSGFSRNESRVAMLIVGSVSQLAVRYAQDLQNNRTTEVGGVVQVGRCRLGLEQWGELLEFTGKAFDPTRRTPFAIQRVERRLQKRLLEMKSALDAAALSSR